MWNDFSYRTSIAMGVLAMFCTLLVGCGGYKMPAPLPTETTFRLTHHTGGTHYRVLVHEGRCIVAFSNSVQVVDPTTLLVVHDVPLGTFGGCGPVIDLAIDGGRLWAVVEDDAVVELSIRAGFAPTIRETISSERLGILPRTLSVVDDEVYVSGVGGVVRLGDFRRMFTSDEMCGSVARVGDELVTCVGRSVYRMTDGGYIGAASVLVRLPDSIVTQGDAPALQPPQPPRPPHFAYALHTEGSALAGVLDADVREVVGIKSTVAVPERLERLRVQGERLHLVSPQGIDIYDLAAGTLRLVESIDVLGARDVVQLDERTSIIVGSAGRAIYEHDSKGGPGRFTVAEREASRLTMATGDGLNILAGSREGAWMYLVNARAELTRRTIESAPPGPRTANAGNAQATISLDGLTLSVRPAPIGGENVEPWEYREPKAARLHTVLAVDNDFWVGHDRGITVLHSDGGRSLLDPKVVAQAKKESRSAMAMANPVKERLRLPGPVRYLFPVLTGSGAAYVSEFGGFGAAEFIRREKR